MSLLIETLIAPRRSSQEDKNHQEVRRISTTPISFNIEPPISPAELDLALKTTKLRKAAGPDHMPPEIFKNVDKGNRVDLLTLFNLLLEKEIFQEAWKRAKLKVIRKSGNRDWSNTGSYRPISLLPVAGKIFERVLKQRLSIYLEKNNLLSAHQYGFRPNRSTVQAIDLLKTTATNQIVRMWWLFL